MLFYPLSHYEIFFLQLDGLEVYKAQSEKFSKFRQPVFENAKKDLAVLWVSDIGISVIHSLAKYRENYFTTRKRSLHPNLKFFLQRDIP